jgi:glutamyl-tRNA reductase
MSDAATFFMLGASHHSAPLAVRERLALTPEKIATLRTRLGPAAGVRELAVLSTCNRVEFYGVAGAAAVARLEDEFCALQGVAAAEFAGARRHAAGGDAVAHLLAVAAGLDSQLVGENEIFGQVKDAYAEASAGGAAGPVLHRVFQKIFQHAKHIRTHTGVAEGAVSVANVAVELALNIFGQLDATRVLLLGAGEIGEKTAKAFQSRGASGLTVASRTLGRAMELADTLGALAMPFWLAPVKLGDFDIVVGSTAASEAVVTRAAAAAAIRRRPGRPLFFIDLALPRDIEPAVAELENVFLYNLDDLAKIADANRAAREVEVARARVVVAEKAEQLWRQIGPRLAADGGGAQNATGETSRPPAVG